MYSVLEAREKMREIQNHMQHLIYVHMPKWLLKQVDKCEHFECKFPCAEYVKYEHSVWNGWYCSCNCGNQVSQ